MAEHKKGAAGRFAPGLPSKSDGQMLFMLNGVAKLKENGRMAIIQNGSSLFIGDAAPVSRRSVAILLRMTGWMPASYQRVKTIRNCQKRTLSSLQRMM